MKGTVIAIDRDKGFCDIYCSESIETYRAELGSFASDEAMAMGADVEADVESSPSMFSPGKAVLTSVKALVMHNEKVGLTTEARYPEHETIKDEREYLIAAEGASERECRSALIEKAIECNVNGLLDMKLEVVTRPGVKTALFRYTARPAIIEGPKYHQQPGQGMTIPVKLARRNSPNEAMVRYIRVLLISFLFVAIPSIMSLAQGGVIPSKMMGQIITAGLLVASMVLFFLVFFRKRQSFILTLKSIRS